MNSDSHAPDALCEAAPGDRGASGEEMVRPQGDHRAQRIIGGDVGEEDLKGAHGIRPGREFFEIGFEPFLNLMTVFPK